MLCTVAGNPAWRDFSPFGRKIPEGSRVLIIDHKAAIRTELTHLSPVKRPSEPASIIIAVPTVRSIVRHFPPHYHFLFRPLLPGLFFPRSRLLQSLWIYLPLLWLLVLQDPHCH